MRHDTEIVKTFEQNNAPTRLVTSIKSFLLIQIESLSSQNLKCLHTPFSVKVKMNVSATRHTGRQHVM